MSMRNVPVCEHRLTSAICASLPQVRADRMTGEIRTDRATGQPQYEVYVLVTVLDEREPSVINVRVAGEPMGLEIGKPVQLYDLFERKWEMDGGRSGVTYSVSAITAVEPTRPVTVAAAASPESSAPGRGGGKAVAS
jgi:hypothetical protein